MSRFATQLRTLMEARGINQTRACERTGISGGQMSRYVNGKNRPPRDEFAKLANLFSDDADRTDLLVAYLEDRIPKSARGLVRIRRADPRRAPEQFRADMPKRLREALDGLAELAIEDQAVADYLIATWRVLKE
jgi:transcriptional regulator with XRE-family HTH domain